MRGWVVQAGLALFYMDLKYVWFCWVGDYGIARISGATGSTTIGTEFAILGIHIHFC
jgi:hypothetical protein